MVSTTDVCIIGGGLGGLTLALQIRQQSPDTAITIVERSQFPIPEKKAKVGESTVEIGSHYLKTTLGLKQHFSDRHLRKHGLRCFFGKPQTDFSMQDELGVSELFGIPTYQIDRGAIENYLHQHLSALGISIIDQATVEKMDLAGELKQVTIKREHNGQQYKAQTIKSRWLIDAAGRQRLFQQHMDLTASNNHQGNAAWFRVDKQIKLDDWSEDQEWHKRLKQTGTRWLSTNHLMGPGYWVWIIPLDNGATSFGIVGDNQAFANGDFSTFDSTFRWLQIHHPRCAEAIADADVLDFVSVRDYSHSCKQVFSDQGWGISGEAGVFADPFYSPGTDFIAFGNSFISSLIADASKGNDIRLNARVYEQIYQSFFDSTLSLYEGQYGGFGDRKMMSLKLVWDYAYYWGVLSLLFFRETFTDIDFMRQANPALLTVRMANQQVQGAFRARAAKRLTLKTEGLFINQHPIPCLQYFNRVLEKQDADPLSQLTDNCEQLTQLSQHITALLNEKPSPTACTNESELLGEYRKLVLA